MNKNSISNLTQKWHKLRSNCYNGNKNINEILEEYEILEQAMGKLDSNKAADAYNQLQTALILWREDLSCREEAPEFLKKRYESMDAMFSRVLQFLSKI